MMTAREKEIRIRCEAKRGFRKPQLLVAHAEI